MNPLFLLMLPFLCRHYPPLPSVPYAPRSRRCCRLLSRVCVCLSSAATSIPIEPLTFSSSPHYMSSCPARPMPSYLHHPSIFSSLRFAPPPQYFIPTSPPTPSLSIFLLYISINISIYLLSLTFSLLYLSLALCLSIFLLSVLVSRPLTHFITIYY